MLVSFIVIALNAEKCLPRLLECLNRQTYDHSQIEVILVDSGSSDSTRSIMLEFKDDSGKRGYSRVAVLDNPKKTLPCGWNVALNALQGEAVLRVDAHAFFPEDFIEKNVKDLESGEDICGGKVISVPATDSNWSGALNDAENSMFGGSFAAFRHADTRRYVSTAAFAIYRRSVFEKTGQFNESLTRTEDNEMHYRMRRAGYRFLYDPEIVSYRETRDSLHALLRQKYLNGYWIGRTMGVEPRCFSVYHFVPFAFVIAIIFTAILALTGSSVFAKALWIAYGVVDLCMALVSVIASKRKTVWLILLPILFLLLHIWYGVGTVVGLLHMIYIKLSGQKK